MTNHTDESQCPPILERLKASFGTYSRVAAALDVATNYTTRWRADGFIPEPWALAIEELGVRDEWGAITARGVLHEARDARMARISAVERYKLEIVAAAGSESI